MANNWPGPTYNRLIESDPQIVKVNLDVFEWGARQSIFPKGTDPGRPGAIHGAPAAPELTVKHV